jgi:hypothetical protein
MALTIGNMAKVQTQSALAAGQAQAGQMGLGKKEGDLLGVSNLMGGQNQGKGLVNKLMGPGSQNRLRGAGFQEDLQDIAGAALAIGPGRGSGGSASSSMRPTGGILNKVV